MVGTDKGNMSTPEHLSTTQLLMISRCPYQWKRRYLDGDKRPPGIAMLVGSGAHVGFETGMRHKQTHGADLPPNDVRDAAVVGFDERYNADEVTLTPEETSKGLATVVGESRDRVAALAHYWALIIQPDYQPVEIEHRWDIDLPNIGTKLVGVTDVVTEGRAVVDWKTGRRKIARRECNSSLQLTAYAFAYHVEHGEPPAEVRLEQLLEKPLKTERNQIGSTRSRADYNCLLARVSEVVKMIRGGAFPPGLPSEWWCSTKWCGYARTCPYYNPERDKEE